MDLWCDMSTGEQHGDQTRWRITYRQLAFKLREWRAEYKPYVTPCVIGALVGGVKEAIHEITKIFKEDHFSKKIVGEMQRPTDQNNSWWSVETDQK